MHAPPVALDVIADGLAGFHLDAGDPEDLTARRLEIEPHGLAVPAPPFVAVDFHVHRPLVDQPHLTAVAPDRPCAVQLVPRAFVAI